MENTQTTYTEADKAAVKILSIGSQAMRFNQGDRVKPTAEALRLRVWTATRLGFRPCDRRGTILRCWQDKVEVKWDLPIGSLKRNGVMVAKRFLELST